MAVLVEPGGAYAEDEGSEARDALSIEGAALRDELIDRLTLGGQRMRVMVEALGVYAVGGEGDHEAAHMAVGLAACYPAGLGLEAGDDVDVMVLQRIEQRRGRVPRPDLRGRP